MPNRLVSEVLKNRPVVTISPKASVEEAAVLMRNSKVGALMVVENGRLVGIFTERDALFRVLAQAKNPATTSVDAVMTANPMSIPPDRPFGNALHLMHENGFRHVPVVVNGWPVGVVSARDALSADMARFENELLRRDEILEILA